MGEEEAGGSGGLGFGEGLFPGGVAPADVVVAAVADVFVGGVLGVVDEDVGSGGEALDRGAELSAVFGVGAESEDGGRATGAVFFDAVAEATAGMVKGCPGDVKGGVGAGELDGIGGEVGEGEFGGHVFEIDGEAEVVLLAAEGAFERADGGVGVRGKGGAEEVEGVFWMEGGHEKGEALDVVPVEVTEEEGGVEGLGPAEEVEAEKAEAGAGVEDEEEVAGLD